MSNSAPKAIARPPTAAGICLPAALVGAGVVEAAAAADEVAVGPVLSALDDPPLADSDEAGGALPVDVARVVESAGGADVVSPEASDDDAGGALPEVGAGAGTGVVVSEAAVPEEADSAGAEVVVVVVVTPLSTLEAGTEVVTVVDVTAAGLVSAELAEVGADTGTGDVPVAELDCETAELEVPVEAIEEALKCEEVTDEYVPSADVRILTAFVDATEDPDTVTSVVAVEDGQGVSAQDNTVKAFVVADVLCVSRVSMPALGGFDRAAAEQDLPDAEHCVSVTVKVLVTVTASAVNTDTAGVELLDCCSARTG
jgi:hypothetical protein